MTDTTTPIKLAIDRLSREAHDAAELDEQHQAVDTDTATIRTTTRRAQTALAAVRKLHTPHEEEILPYACMEGHCDHPAATRDADGCPTVKVQVCTECTNLAWAKDPEWLPGEARFPCATIKAIEAVLA